MPYNVDYSPMSAIADLSIRAGQARSQQQGIQDSLQAGNLNEEVRRNMANEQIQAMQARGMLARLYDQENYHQGTLDQRQYATDMRGNIAGQNNDTREDIAGQNNQTKTGIAGMVDQTRQRGQDMRNDLGYDKLDAAVDQFDQTHALQVRKIADQAKNQGTRTKLALLVQQQAQEKSPVEGELRQIGNALKDPMLKNADRQTLTTRQQALFGQLRDMGNAHSAQLTQLQQDYDGGSTSIASGADKAGVKLNPGAEQQGEQVNPHIMQIFTQKHGGDPVGAAIELSAAGYNAAIPAGVKVASKDDVSAMLSQAKGDPAKAKALAKQAGFNYDYKGVRL